MTILHHKQHKPLSLSRNNKNKPRKILFPPRPPSSFLCQPTPPTLQQGLHFIIQNRPTRMVRGTTPSFGQLPKILTTTAALSYHGPADALFQGTKDNNLPRFGFGFEKMMAFGFVWLSEIQIFRINISMNVLLHVHGQTCNHRITCLRDFEIWFYKSRDWCNLRMFFWDNSRCFKISLNFEILQITLF